MLKCLPHDVQSCPPKHIITFPSTKTVCWDFFPKWPLCPSTVVARSGMTVQHLINSLQHCLSELPSTSTKDARSEILDIHVSLLEQCVSRSPPPPPFFLSCIHKFHLEQCTPQLTTIKNSTISQFPWIVALEEHCSYIVTTKTWVKTYAIQQHSLSDVSHTIVHQATGFDELILINILLRIAVQSINGYLHFFRKVGHDWNEHQNDMNMCVYVHVWECVHVHVWVCVFMQVHVCVHACKCVSVCMHVCVSVCACKYVCVCVCICM